MLLRLTPNRACATKLRNGRGRGRGLRLAGQDALISSCINLAACVVVDQVVLSSSITQRPLAHLRAMNSRHIGAWRTSSRWRRGSKRARSCSAMSPSAGSSSTSSTTSGACRHTTCTGSSVLPRRLRCAGCHDAQSPPAALHIAHPAARVFEADTDGQHDRHRLRLSSR